MNEKRELRKTMATRRAEAHGRVDDAPALQTLREALVEAVHPISFYWPIRSEIDPRPVMEEMAERGTVCLPVTSGYNPLAFREWQPSASMSEDGFGVAVPEDGAACFPQTLVIPLLAFDRTGMRLGYGAGHYDRTLEQLRKRHEVLAIGFAYAAQECAEVPTEPTDQPLDLIITEVGPIVPA